ncbi:major facilitator superfamily domain-containing protein [Mycotypha africana]|uniref:major facilitator superfamily domain-containing protein n=1 Tax=Mycotypha africana TaxID=64632 RepID=UPI0023008A52|nr:major facilitator superfamily domain-containing protein [Mycotypha africana]KAI8990893.1 major facilitator superfamily domain-containing protein [Mycotypha africana]
MTMEPVKRILSQRSTKSYLENVIVSLNDNGPLVGPSLEVMDSQTEPSDNQHHLSRHHDSSSALSHTIIEKEPGNIDLFSKFQSSPTKQTNQAHQNRKRWRFWSHKEEQQKKEDFSDPKQFPRYKKNMILLVVALAGSVSPVSSTIYYPALLTMQDYFQTNDTTMNASISIFTFFTAFFPLIWATFGDRIGSLCCALSVNAQMFIVFRAISAVGSSSAMSMGAGTIADIFEPSERGRAFSYYTCGPLLGPAVGPIIGGYLNEGLGWRSNFYFLTIFVFLNWLGIVFALPETWRATPSDTAALPIEKVVTMETFKDARIKGDQNVESPQQTKSDIESQQAKTRNKTNFVNPIEALNLLRYPNIALCIGFISVLTNFTRIYTVQYGFDSGLVGVCYLPAAAGLMAGGIIGGRTSDKIFNRNREKVMAKNEEVYPEMRLGGPYYYAAIVLQLFAFIAYGWCIEKNVHFAYGLVCQAFLGLALMFPNVAINAYMVDCFRKRGASVTACNNFARYIMAGIGSLIASDILKALGSGILFTVCGAALFLTAINLIIVEKYPQKWSIYRENAGKQ